MAAELIERLRLAPAQETHITPDMANSMSDDEVWDYLRLLHNQLTHHQVTTSIVRIVGGALMYPHDQPENSVYYFLRITPINCMDTLLYHERGRDIDETELHSLWAIATDIARLTRAFYERHREDQHDIVFPDDLTIPPWRDPTITFPWEN